AMGASLHCRWLAVGQDSLRSTIEGHDARCGRSDQTIGASQTRPSESINASGRCHAELSRDSHQPHLRVSGASLQRCQALCPTSGAAAAVWRQAAAVRFAAEQKERDWRCCVFAAEKTFVCNPRPTRRNDVIWTDDPSTIEPIVRVAHSVSINAFGAFSASGKSPLFFFSENLTAPL